MDKIFKQAKDKNVAKVIIYGHTDNLLYSDSGHTNKLDKVSLKDLFFKGCVVKTESEDLLPVKYFETDVYAGFILKSDDSIDIYHSKEYTPEPSGISIIPINSYTTEDTGYGDGFLDITAIVPPVIDEAIFETYSAAIIAALADDSLDNINHTITIGNQTLTDQIATYNETNEIVYLGNLSLYDDSAEDTGEDWFLIVGSTLELTTRTPMTINFGMRYETEEPVPSGTELVPLAEYTTLPGEGTRGAYEYELPENVVEAYYAAVQSASDTSDIKHNVVYNGTAYVNKTIINDYYIGNGYLVGASEVDTGEDWCFLVGSGFVLVTRAPATVTFGVNYNAEAPTPSEYTWDGVWDSSKETDIEVAGMQLHKFADVIPDAQLIGATVEHSGGTQTITAETIEEVRMGSMLVFGNIMLIGTNDEYGINGSYFVAPETPSVIKLTLGGASSGYTWDGVAVEGDIEIEDLGVLHKVSDDKLLPEDLVGGTVTFNLNPETQEETPSTYTIVSGEPGSGEIAVAVSEDNGFTEIGSFGSFYSGEGDLGEYSLNGTYFLKLDPLGGLFITELNPPTE